MERKRRICTWLLGLICVLAGGCTALDDIPVADDVELRISVPAPVLKSVAPDEDRISDLNVLVYDEHGFLEEALWLPSVRASRDVSVHLKLLCGKKYDMFVTANTGMKILAGTMTELLKKKCYLAYPDEYQDGMPMAGQRRGVIVDSKRGVSIDLERLMAKICLRMDRSALDDDVSIYVNSVKLRNCPRNATLFVPNRVDGADECFDSGYMKSGYELDVLNGGDDMSGTVSLYMLENMQGTFPGTGNKVFGQGDPLGNVCSYVELTLTYLSDTKYSESPLIYRFYLGENDRNLDVERNCQYLVTVKPCHDGLGLDDWRIDKSGITDREDPYFEIFPGKIVKAKVGEKVHVYCKYAPSYAAFDVGLEELEEDRKRGIYDYEIDDDGHGVVLSMLKEGSGLLYFSVGEPVNEVAAIVVSVEGYMD
ncbi:MAG: hypothetical protein ACI3ZQ_02565 [Candidatus Cryptobacteroides sp.]